MNLNHMIVGKMGFVRWDEEVGCGLHILVACIYNSNWPGVLSVHCKFA